MSTIEPANTEQTRWAELIDRLVDGVTNLAGDRLKLAGYQAKEAVGGMLVTAGIWAAAGLFGILAVIFLCLGTIEWLEPADRLGPAGARLVVGLILLLIAGATAAYAVWSSHREPSPTVDADIQQNRGNVDATQSSTTVQPG